MRRTTPLLPVVFLLVIPILTFPVHAWGPYGHELSARAAVAVLPETMPAFFREAADQLIYLNPEPDRWRDGRESTLDPAMNGAYSPEHFLDLEIVPEGALEADDRLGFLRVVADGRMPGLSLYRMLELYQRLRLEFRLWREESDPRVRSWIEQRIVNDAGILGHYLTDAANPLHTTIHFDGWIGANPEGYATGDGIHQRFESAFVQARVTLGDLEPLLGRGPRVWNDPRQEILDHIGESFALVETLYVLDREDRFGATTDAGANHALAAGRLSSGALALRDAWWSAWVTSDPDN
jgi:hypothetical protein